jgi:hypothetical protein
MTFRATRTIIEPCALPGNERLLARVSLWMAQVLTLQACQLDGSVDPLVDQPAQARVVAHLLFDAGGREGTLWRL